MIGVVRKDTRCPPQLFGKHCPRHEVRPGRLAEGQEEVGGGSGGVVEPVRAAYHEAGLALAGIAPLLDPAGKIGGAELLAFFIEENENAVIMRRRNLAAAFRQLADLRRPGDPLQVPLDEFGFGAAPDPPPRDDVEQQGSVRGRRRGRAFLERPHPLEIVEAAHFRAEQVDDHVVGIDQHPVGNRQSFDSDIAAEFLLDSLG